MGSGIDLYGSVIYIVGSDADIISFFVIILYQEKEISYKTNINID